MMILHKLYHTVFVRIINLAWRYKMGTKSVTEKHDGCSGCSKEKYEEIENIIRSCRRDKRGA